MLIASARMASYTRWWTVLVALLALALMNGCSSGTHATIGVSGHTPGPTGIVAHYVSGSCARELFAPRATPKALGAPLQASVLSRFALLRRKALPGDELAKGVLASELYNSYELASYYPAYVRRLQELDGRHYFVVPAFAQQMNMTRVECLSRRADRAALLAQQRRRAAEPLYCLIAVPEPQGMYLGCEPFAAIGESARVFGASDFLRQPLVELVPDGVAAVRITYLDRPPVIVVVSENAFAFTPPPAPPSVAAAIRRLQGRALSGNPSQYNKALVQTDPTRLEWLNHAGAVIRTIEPPTKASVEATSIGGIRAPIEG